MNKLFAIAVLALSPLLAVAAQPESVMTESVTDGHTVRTRSLNDRGVLTESTCAVAVEEGVTKQHCVSRSARLSPKQQVALLQSMQSAQASMLSYAYSDQSASKSRSESFSREAAYGAMLGAGSAAMHEVTQSLGGSSVSVKGQGVSTKWRDDMSAKRVD